MADTVSPTVRGELRAEMARREISGRAAAKVLGVSPMWVSNRLSGTTQITVDDLARFAGMLGVPVAQLLGDGSTASERVA